MTNNYNLGDRHRMRHCSSRTRFQLYGTIASITTNSQKLESHALCMYSYFAQHSRLIMTQLFFQLRWPGMQR